jgi:putative phosphoribosyl transferase
MLVPGRVAIGPLALEGELVVPAGARAVVAFAHGSGSSRLSPRNRQVAAALHAAGLGTLLFDLLTPAEAQDRARVFDIPLLASRLAEAVDELRSLEDTRGLPVGLFGASTGAAAALAVSAARADEVYAVVSRGGRPDLAAGALRAVRTPTLLIVGSDDTEVLALNRAARRQMTAADVELAIVPGASHLFEEPGTLETVAALAAAWFVRHAPQPPNEERSP